MTDTESTAIPQHFADQRLVGVLVRHHGTVAEDQLRAAGYSAARIRRLLTRHVLVPTKAGGYVFPDPALYIDALVLIQWRLPDGIFGGRTALVFHDLTVALPKEFDVCVPEALRDRMRTLVPQDLAVRPFTLPDTLRTYGVMQVYPSQPGDVPVAMYRPAVAVAQTLAEPYYTAEVQEDCVSTYVQEFGLDAALREAVARYGVEARLHALLSP